MPKIAGKQIVDNTITSTQTDDTGTLSTINAGDAAAQGSATGLARKDHQHPVATGAGTADIEIGDTAAEGSSSDLARADHVHAVPAPAAPANVTKAAASAGAAITVARADHKHDVDTATAVELTDSTNAEGSSTSLARADHTHGHGNRGGGTLHAAATPSVAGFMSAADKAKLDTLVDPNLVAPKDSVRLLATANLGTLSGNQTVDGILTAPGDRVALFSQSTTSQDGIYVAAAGAWARADDFAATSGQAGAVFAVEEGSTNGDTFWQVTNDAGSDVVGTDDLAIAQIGSGSPRGAGAGLVLNVNDLDVVANGDGSIVVNANDIQVGVITEPQHGDQPLNDGLQHAAATGAVNGFMSAADKTKLDGIDTGAEVNDTPNQEAVTTEAITGTDTVMSDTLNNAPISSASVQIYLNGVLQEQGAGKDYTVSGSSITWLAASGTAVDQEVSDVMTAVYLS